MPFLDDLQLYFQSKTDPAYLKDLQFLDYFKLVYSKAPAKLCPTKISTTASRSP